MYILFTPVVRQESLASTHGYNKTGASEGIPEALPPPPRHQGHWPYTAEGRWQ